MQFLKVSLEFMKILDMICLNTLAYSNIKHEDLM